MSWIGTKEEEEEGKGERKEFKELKEGKLSTANTLETWYCMRCTSANLAPIRGRLVGLDNASKEPDRLCVTCENYSSALLCHV